MPKTTDIYRKETNNQNQGKGADAKSPFKMFKGSKNPTKGGGINRATKGK